MQKQMLADFCRRRCTENCRRCTVCRRRCTENCRRCTDRQKLWRCFPNKCSAGMSGLFVVGDVRDERQFLSSAMYGAARQKLIGVDEICFVRHTGIVTSFHMKDGPILAVDKCEIIVGHRERLGPDDEFSQVIGEFTQLLG